MDPTIIANMINEFYLQSSYNEIKGDFRIKITKEGSDLIEMIITLHDCIGPTFSVIYDPNEGYEVSWMDPKTNEFTPFEKKYDFSQKPEDYQPKGVADFSKIYPADRFKNAADRLNANH